MYISNPYTHRLHIRQLQLNDVPAWTEFFIDNPSLHFLGLDITVAPQQQATAWIQRQLKRYEDGLYGHLALTDRESGTLIGQCGLLVQEVEGKKEIEIGYHILRRYQGHGYATEAATHFRQQAFAARICDSLISMIHIDNIKSQRVAEKNGMTKTIQTDCFQMPVYIYRTTQAAE